MSQPTTVKHYDDIVKDSSILWLFLEKKWMPIQNLQLLGTLWHAKEHAEQEGSKVKKSHKKKSKMWEQEEAS